MAKIEYYIRGNFNGKGIEKVSGYQFDVGNPPQTFYYTKYDDGKYVVTIPCNGMKLGAFDRLKDAKKFIAHVTLMRSANISSGNLPTPVGARGDVDSIVLFHSDLSGPRPVYEPLHCLTLL